MTYCVYMLRCEGGALYSGITTDLERRFAEHSGRGGRGAKYTALRRPVRFEAAWSAPDRAEASRLEYRLKALTHAGKERLILGGRLDGVVPPSCRRLEITETGRILHMLFICYPKCSTCKKARGFLDDGGLEYDVRDIKLENPTEAELREWRAKSGLPLKRFFNTSGLQYKALGLAARLPDMTEDEQYKLLASDGMLVRRPILVSGSLVLVGFKQPEWEERLS